MHQAIINEKRRRHEKKMRVSKGIYIGDKERENKDGDKKGKNNLIEIKRGKEFKERDKEYEYLNLSDKERREEERLLLCKKLNVKDLDCDVKELILGRLLNCYLNRILYSCLDVWDLNKKDLFDIYVSKDIINFLEAKLSDYPDKRFVKKHLIKILFFISCVYFFRITARKTKDQFVYLPYRFLASVIGQRHYPKVLEIVLSTGVLKTDGFFIYNGPKGKGCEQKKKEEKWIPGKAYGYRLNKRFWYSKFKTIPTHLKIRRGMLKFKTEDQNHLIKSMDRASLPVEIAQEIVNYSNKSERAKEIQFQLIDQFKNKQFFQSISTKTSRVFNNISSFQRDVRCLIRIDNEPTTEIDISGSQPLLLNTFYKYNCEESLRFKKLTEDGKFYEYLQAQTGLTNYEKRQLKDEVYRVLFGPMRYQFEFKIKEWFENNYPILWDEIKEIKKTHHSEVPIRLQKMESRVVIEGIVRKFRLKEIPIITVHDSFIVRRRDADLLRRTVVEQFQKIYNLTPRLKEEEKFKEADYYWEIEGECLESKLDRLEEIVEKKIFKRIPEKKISEWWENVILG